MTNEQIETELKHLATKEDVALLRVEMHKELASLIKWMIGLQIPTWLGLIGVLLKK
jgi:hypothetical protein